MDILENLDQWFNKYKESWLKTFEETGTFNWKIYPRPTNTEAPSGAAINLKESRLILISTAGGYLTGKQQPFDAANPLGDYTIRTFPTRTAFEEISYAHDHYDKSAVTEDPQVLLPLRHLETLVAQGVIGELAPSVISYMGYQPDATRTVNELIPQILDVAKNERAKAALLVPA